MSYSTVPYDYLRVRVQNKSTLAWTEIMAAGNEINIDRGGFAGILGLDSVNVGLATFVLYNSLDPAVVSTLSPKMPIQVYSTQFATPDEGSIYLGTIADVSSQYVLNDRTFAIDTYVTITAVDAVQAHANITVPGVTTAAGYQRWEERISTLQPYAITTVNVPAINQNTVVDSF
jgi:hypothetical protein